MLLLEGDRRNNTSEVPTLAHRSRGMRGASTSGILVWMMIDLPTTGGMPILLLIAGVVILGSGILLYVLFGRGGGVG